MPSFAMAELSYKVAFGRCPVQTTGPFIKGLVEVFKKDASLFEIKKEFEKLENKQKYFYNSYRAHYLPFENILTLKVDCPRPLMRLEVFENNKVKYEAIVSESGEMIDPNYENMLRNENLLKTILPTLSLNTTEIQPDIVKMAISFYKLIDDQKHLSEISYGKDGWVGIFSYDYRPILIWLGKDDIEDKLRNLNKILHFFSVSNNFPFFINMTNAEKIVVKFK
jgi:hypothetical protein